LRNQGKEWKGVHVFGQEVNGLTSAIARMNLYLNGVEDFSIVCGDTLRNPAFLDGSHLRTFDIVLANPPYSIKEWDRAAFENDKWGRNFLGTPPQGRADYAFIQHILASMDEKNGRCAILLPHGVLFRKEEQEIRKKMIEADLLEAVIGIGPNLFFNATMEACIYICRSNKPVERRNKIMFINAVKEVTRRNGESFLEEQHIQKIVDAYNGYVDVENFCSVVDIAQIEKNEYNLNVSLYAHINSVERQILGIETAISEWNVQHSMVMQNINSLKDLIV
jgi:type I restriction enzyme M protein